MVIHTSEGRGRKERARMRRDAVDLEGYTPLTAPDPWKMEPKTFDFCSHWLLSIEFKGVGIVPGSNDGSFFFFIKKL